ncbi:GNAT family N-acetyltransferase [Devosia sp. MC532]|uniref:GNAT family N-acetyltransferase n=1 Tax=Devosia sp. MC532 TaxID=2799788 RepID=UPI0018F6E66D|nr:GNAT family N-acetyltransferase [Devosia sp. MC532]MBJ7577293.1 GNAT family N-acetyltransferase [Devosia sp. MC532]
MIQIRDVAWRAMTGYDMDAVNAIAGRVHPGFFEAPEVLAEKFQLYRNGCYLFEVQERPAGYMLSHPWKLGSLPALNALLGQLPDDLDTYYIHDLALLPLARGVGAAGKIVSALTKHAAAMGYPTMSLVAVNGSVSFWEKQGFQVEDRPELAEKLSAYEAHAEFMVKRIV